MKRFPIGRVIKKLRVAVQNFKTPAVSRRKVTGGDPFKILIATIISLRTKDQVTEAAASRLFRVADSPEKISKSPIGRLEKLIYPSGFYRNKARVIKELSAKLAEDYGGQVPDDLEELLKLRGVGRKTANLVITEGFGRLGICVDTHVHRLMNRFGYVRTKTPEETEFALRKKLPKKYWLEINRLLVTWGQNVCQPISPRCSICVLDSLCQKIGVKRHR